MIPYGRQSIDQADIDAVNEVMHSKFLTTGPYVDQFETALIEASEYQQATVFNSATSALHASCLALGINHQSRVWVPANSFVATANCAEYCGAKVNFVDVELDTGNICTQALEESLKKANAENLLPDLLIVVHYSGHFCDMPRIYQLSKHYGFSVIEDASHALGAVAPNSWSPEIYGKIRIYSFHPVKMITSAEGGVALSNDESLAKKIRLYGNHGIEREAKNWHYPSDGDWYYEQQLLGYNYRMSDLHAALGLSQLKKLAEFISKRKQLVHHYHQLMGESVRWVNQSKHGESSYHLLGVLLPEQRAKDIFSAMRANGIGVQKHYIPIVNHPYYQNKYSYDIAAFPNAQTFYRQVMALPLYCDLGLSEVKQVCRELKKALKG